MHSFYQRNTIKDLKYYWPGIQFIKVLSEIQNGAVCSTEKSVGGLM